MKILHISNYYHPHIGGIERVARDCVNALAGMAEQRLICFHTEKKDETDLIDEVPVVRVGCFAKIASQSLSFRYGKILKKQIEEFQPDVVLLHYPNPFATHYLLKILKKHPDCKLIVYWHLDIYKQKLLKKFFHRQNIRLCNRATVVVGATPAHLKDSAYYKWFRDKCKTLPYGISAERLFLTKKIVERAEQIRGENRDKTICFALGRQVPYKGTEYLVRASALLDDRFRIFIAGEGELTPMLKKLAEPDKKVRFLGQIDDSETVAYMKACDIFCFPSITRNEGFGLAMAEAMYLGKPAVTFTIPKSGVNYVNLNGITGIEVENRNVEAYAKAIETLAADDALREQYGAAAKERVENHFTEVIFRQNMQQLIQEI